MVGPKITKENYKSIERMISSENTADIELAFSMLNSYRADNNFIFYGLLVIKKIYDSFWSENWVRSLCEDIEKKILRTVYRKSKKYKLVSKMAVQHWLSIVYGTDDRSINELCKLLKELNIEYTD